MRVEQLAAIIGRGNSGLLLARALHREGVRTRKDLRRPEVLARLPRESQARVIFSPARGVPLTTALAVANEMKRRLAFGARCSVIPVGSVRRRAPRSKDIDLLIVSAQPLLLTDAKLLHDGPLSIADVYSSGPRRCSLIVREEKRGARARHFQIDLFRATPAEKPYALFHFTGGRVYNIRTRAHAKKLGWKLNQYGVFDAGTGARVRGSGAVRTERNLAAFLGVTYRAPTQRSG